MQILRLEARLLMTYIAPTNPNSLITRHPRPCLPAVAERRREPGSPKGTTRLCYFAILTLIETFWASAAYPSTYFLLHAQKKVPKKRAATAKRQPPRKPAPHSTCPPGMLSRFRARSVPRHARTPRKIMLDGKIHGWAWPSPSRPATCRAARPLRCRCIPARPAFIGGASRTYSPYYL
jgi:hypothetical protein